MLGGTDAGDQSQAVIKQLKGYEVFHAQGSKDVSELLTKVDLAIVAPGFSMWESLCVGCPALVVPQNSRQRISYQELPLVEQIGSIPELINKRRFVYPKPEYEIGMGKNELIEEVLSGH